MPAQRQTRKRNKVYVYTHSGDNCGETSLSDNLVAAEHFEHTSYHMTCTGSLTVNREFLAIQQGVLRNDPDSAYQSEDADGDIGYGDGGRSFFDDGSLTAYDTNEDPGADDRDREQDTSPLEVPKRKQYASVSA